MNQMHEQPFRSPFQIYPVQFESEKKMTLGIKKKSLKIPKG